MYACLHGYHTTSSSLTSLLFSPQSEADNCKGASQKSLYILQVENAVIMPISYICQSNSTAVTSELSKTPDGRALLTYLNQHTRDSDMPVTSTATNSSSTASNNPSTQHFSIESLFGPRSPLFSSGLGLFAQLLNPQLAESGGMMHIGTNDSGDGNAGRAVVLLMRGGQPASLQASGH